MLQLDIRLIHNTEFLVTIFVPLCLLSGGIGPPTPAVSSTTGVLPLHQESLPQPDTTKALSSYNSSLFSPQGCPLLSICSPIRSPAASRRPGRPQEGHNICNSNKLPSPLTTLGESMSMGTKPSCYHFDVVLPFG